MIQVDNHIFESIKPWIDPIIIPIIIWVYKRLSSRVEKKLDEIIEHRSNKFMIEMKEYIDKRLKEKSDA